MKLKNLILFIIGLGALAYILIRMDVNVAGVIKSVKSPVYVLLATLVVVATPVIIAIRMKFFIDTIEKKNIALKDLFMIEYIYKFLLNVMPFKLNLPAKAMLLNKKYGLKLSNGASIVSFEYALDSGVIICFGFLGVISYFREDPRISLLSIKYFIFIVLSGSTIFFLIPSKYFELVLTYAETFRIKTIQKIATFLVKMVIAIRISWVKILLDRKMYAVLFTTILIWGAAILVNMLLFMSTNNYVPPTWILVVMSVGLFVGGISAIPGGLGVREATMVVLYSALGVSAETGVAVVLLNRILSTLPIIIGYLYSIKIGYDRIM